MAFDALFTSAVAFELAEKINGGRVEKIFQPTRDSLLFFIHPVQGKTVRLIIDVNPSNCRMGLTEAEYENPLSPPMLCMLLRKHLAGGKILSVSQPVFDRIIRIEFSARDELGYETRRFIFCELMGRYGNIIFCDGENRVISAVRMKDITSGELRPIYPGAVYSFPPLRGNGFNPLLTPETVYEDVFSGGIITDKLILRTFEGLSPLICREIVFRGGNYSAFSEIVGKIRDNEIMPTAVIGEDGSPVEFSFTNIKQYSGLKTENFGSLSELLDYFYSTRAKVDSISRRCSDIVKLLQNNLSRLVNKIEKQEAELKKCSEKEKYREYGDLITSNLYRLKERTGRAEVVNFYSTECEKIVIELDSRLSASQNAQRFYKQYAKAKSAERNLAVQIENAKTELEYINSVLASVRTVENENDINDIRRELAEQGYLRYSNLNVPKKMPASKPMIFRTTGGYTVLCGKNNIQNELITNRLAGKNDIWFHIKEYHGSHVVLICNGEEPSSEDYTEAATIAATYSSAEKGQKVSVDYTRVKNLKKPPSSRPGFITFSKNYSAYVTPDTEMCARLKC